MRDMGGALGLRVLIVGLLGHTRNTRRLTRTLGHVVFTLGQGSWDI